MKILIIALILTFIQPVTAKSNKDNQKLINASVNGDINMVKEILIKGNVDVYGKSASLRYSVEESKFYIAETLLKYNADPNYYKLWHQNPLITAAELNDYDMAYLLLDSGAKAYRWGQHLYYAIYNQNYKLVELLLKNSANPNADTQHYLGLIGQAAVSQCENCVIHLLNYGAEFGTSHLRLLGQEKLFDAFNLMLDKGQGPNDIINSSGLHTYPLFYAIKSYSSIKKLLELGAYPNCLYYDKQSKWFNTAITYILKDQENYSVDEKIDLIKLLFKYGAKANIVNGQKQSPLFLAKNYNDNSLVVLIQEELKKYKKKEIGPVYEFCFKY